jgi:hypothetical protein
MGTVPPLTLAVEYYNEELEPRMNIHDLTDSKLR